MTLFQRYFRKHFRYTKKTFSLFFGAEPLSDLFKAKSRNSDGNVGESNEFPSEIANLVVSFRVFSLLVFFRIVPLKCTFLEAK